MRRDEKIEIIGITGGIACGKTVATDALAAAGYTIVDADEASRALTAVGSPAECELIRMFPTCAENGVLARRKLRELISSDRNAMRALNDYTHPLIVAEVKRALEKAKKPAVLSAPLLFETALSALCDVTVCIVCPKSTRLKRLTARDGISETAAAAIIDAQIPDCIRAAVADRCISSDCDENTFRARILDLFANILKT